MLFLPLAIFVARAYNVYTGDVHFLKFKYLICDDLLQVFTKPTSNQKVSCTTGRTLPEDILFSVARRCDDLTPVSQTVKTGIIHVFSARVYFKPDLIFDC